MRLKPISQFHLKMAWYVIFAVLVYSRSHTIESGIYLKAILPQVNFVAMASVKDLIYKGVCHLEKVNLYCNLNTNPDH